MLWLTYFSFTNKYFQFLNNLLIYELIKTKSSIFSEFSHLTLIVIKVEIAIKISFIRLNNILL